MTSDPVGSALLVDVARRRAANLPTPSLERIEERHKVDLDLPPQWRGMADAFAEAAPQAPLLLLADSGLLTFRQLRLAQRGRAGGRRVFVWWRSEHVLEALEGEDLLRLGAQWMLARAHRRMEPSREIFRRILRAAGVHRRRDVLRPRVYLKIVKGGLSRIGSAALGAWRGDLAAVQRLLPDLGLASVRRLVANTRMEAKPAALPLPGADGVRLPARGVYVRLDWWNAISSGGSYGHTCFVAAELAKRSEGFACLMANRFELLDELGVPQHRVDPPFEKWGEAQQLRAAEISLHALRPALRLMRPGFVYERLVPGNFAVTRACQEIGIPYVVEYNGSEISMMRSFGDGLYRHEAILLESERAAFAQAALISVVSDAIRQSLVEQGVPFAKILVDPNGVDPDYYAPATAEERGSIRRELGWGEEEFVVGFTGTFGGWHGIDDLAQILPRVCKEEPRVRFLLIGDGSYQHLIDRAIAEHGLGSKVVCTGRVPQQQGARLLRACDAFVSPHNSHMVDSRFFGSPTKLFEYMAVGGAIVASDLEQIGEVLRPAIDPSGVSRSAESVQRERAVLCRPGDIQGFVDALVGLARNRGLARALGKNAREAAVGEFSWARHVERLTAALGGAGAGASWAPPPSNQEKQKQRTLICDDDAYKREAQQQWNEDPCGSQYVDEAADGTLDWFREVETYRYDVYAPWMRRVLEFESHAGEDVLEVGGGLGTDLAQFARSGARVTDVDLSVEHLALAQRNFELRGLSGTFIHSDAEVLPFDDGSFDLVYSCGVIHHTPNTRKLVEEMWRVLRPGGKVITMVYAQRSRHYWSKLFWELGVRGRALERMSMGELMSREVELSRSGARPLVKVYTRARLRRIFQRFEELEILQRQLMPQERPSGLHWVNAQLLSKWMGWNLIVKARKPWAV